jgi:non-specific serine/threonine protein kinase
MGVVYLATDPRLDRRVALKVLPRRIARDPERVRRFELEARILAAVDHPNIATIFSLEESDDRHFLTMELVSGETLADRLSRGPVPLESSLDIARQIASALETAHRQGVVHRDLKPANVMVAPGPIAKVMDFGLAKAGKSDSDSTSEGSTASDSFGPVLGTPGYASPEQLRGEDVDHRADVWAFGSVLYECLSGRPAFPGDTPADRIASTLGGGPDWAALPPTTPERLRRLVRCCLERDVGCRVGSIARVRTEIEDILAGRPSSDPSSPVGTEPVATPHNLTLHLASFIGRRDERDDVARALREHRLVTLTGAGGCGKTRLALEVGHGLLAEYPDGVWLANLAGVSDPARVVPSVATVVGVQEEPNRPLVDSLVDHVDGRRLLLILDNCEHLLAACARLVDDLLARVESPRILTTSREALGLAGEVVLRVPPLAVPAFGTPPVLEELRRVESVRLFVERAAAAASGFVLTGENASDVSRICRRLDGIPLAIELAAARIRALPPAEIGRRLDDRLDLLAVGPHAVEPRHQTLRALIDWSHDLLSEKEQTLFRRLSVFAGEFDIDRVETVCAGDGIDRGDILTLLSHLVEQSLLEVRSGRRREASPRYRMLETVRAHARDRLAESEDEAMVRRRHREHFAEVAERSVPGLTGPDQTRWAERLEASHDDLRAAIDDCARSDVPRSLEMAGALGRYWFVRGRWSEGRDLMTELLGRPEAAAGTAGRARALSWTGWLLYWQGEFSGANSVLEEALSIFRGLGDRTGIAEALNNLGAVAMGLGELERSRDCHQEALAIRRRTDDRRAIAVSVHNLGEVYLARGEHEKARAAFEESLSLFRSVEHMMGVADSLSALGQIAEHFGDLERARAHHEESLANRRDRGDPMGTAESLRQLGRLSMRRGDLADAHALLRESLAIHRELGDRTNVASGLEALGELAARDGRAARAARILGAAAALREEIRAWSSAGDRERLEQAVVLTRKALGGERFDAERRAGQAMPIEEAVEFALGSDN